MEYKDDTLRALNWVCRLPEAVAVCGSRFFGDAKPGSDFDFVTENISLLNQAECVGFSDSDSSARGYTDTNTERILQLGRVHLILTKSLSLRLRAREIIAQRGLDRHDTEEWDKVYEELRGS